MWQGFLPFQEIIFHRMHAPHVVYPFIHQWTPGLIGMAALVFTWLLCQNNGVFAEGWPPLLPRASWFLFAGSSWAPHRSKMSGGTRIGVGSGVLAVGLCEPCARVSTRRRPEPVFRRQGVGPPSLGPQACMPLGSRQQGGAQNVSLG